MAGKDLKISMPSEKIKIGRSELPGSAGRGYFAKRDIAAHEELFRRKPLILVPDFDRESSICDWCYIRAVDKYRNGGESQIEKKLMNCAKCNSVWYCCSSCQKQAWHAYHKYECGMFTSKAYKNIESSDLRGGYIRILCRLLCIHRAGNVGASTIKNLCALRNDNNICKRHVGTSSQWPELVLMASITTGTDLPFDQVLMLCSVIICNTISMPSTSGKVLCHGLDLPFAIMNHSCDPNVIHFFEQGQLRVRALKPIRAGDEVTMSYLLRDSGCYPYEQRRTLISQHLMIECGCSRCTSEGDKLQACSQAQQTHRKQIWDVQVGMDFVWDTNKKHMGDRAVLDITIANLKKLQRRAMPNTVWPDDLPPMPEILQEWGTILRGHNVPVESFKLLIKSDFALIDPRDKTPTSKAYIAALLQLTVDIPAFIGHVIHYELYRQACRWEKREFVEEEHDFRPEEMYLLYHGILSIALQALEQHFGSDTEIYKQTFEKLRIHEKAMNQPGVHAHDYLYRSVDGTEPFIEVQSKLLKWASVGMNKLINIPPTARLDWSDF